MKPAEATPGARLGLDRSDIVSMFAAFAFAYFLSALLRAVTATLAPVFSSELGLGAADLGLLAGAYFLGFAAFQLPIGTGLDRFGPRRVILALLVLATLGCVAFASARGLAELVAARMLIGVGVSACLMAPMTCFRQRYSPRAQMRANSWMLMTGSLGMVASTAPLQALLPSLGWRGVFWLTGCLLVAAMACIAVMVPRDQPRPLSERKGASLRQVVGNPLFIRLAPLAFFSYGSLMAVQALWAGPWLTAVSGWSAKEAANGLLLINICMLVSFFAWGILTPRLGHDVEQVMRLLARAIPVSLIVLALIIALGESTTAVHWAAWCVASTVISLSQPALAQAFPVASAGRALTSFNLAIFLGVFVVQWTIGIGIDTARASGFAVAAAYRITFSVLWVACLGAYLWFLWSPRVFVDNRSARTP